MPPGITVLQGIIIAFFVVSDQFLQADILPDNISGSVKNQQRQETTHSSVSVIERMNAKEVQNKNRHQKQRIHIRIVYGIVECVAKCFDCFRSFPCRYRLKTNQFCSIRLILCNDVVAVLIVPAKSRVIEFVQIPVQLKNHVGTYRDKVVILMNRRQYIAVSGNFPFVAVPRSRLVANNLLQPVIRGNDSFNPV